MPQSRPSLVCRALCLGLALWFGLLGAEAIATTPHIHGDQPPPGPVTIEAPGQGVVQITAESGATEVGLEERLGEKIPLELSFRDETGQVVRLGDLISGPTIIAPVYYQCTNVCNFLQGGLAKVLPQIKLKPGVQYQVLSISFDETETPEQARKSKKIYLDAMGGQFPESAWHFLTGDLATIHQLTGAAGYSFKRQGIDFLHPIVVFVVAKDGTIVRYLHGTSFLAMDLSLALMEAEEGRVGTTIRKLVTYCFSYDPEGKRYVFNLLRVSGTVIFLFASGFLALLIFGGKKKRPYNPNKGH
ncbi:MAG: SCO family protein [Trichloromonadaceae bacterium]